MLESLHKRVYKLGNSSEDEKIAFLKRITQFDKLFVPAILNLDELNSIFLQDNRHFIVLKEMLQKYNLRVKGKEPIPGPKQVFYDRIMTLLKEAVNVPNKDVQEGFVAEIYKWVFSEQKDLPREIPHQIPTFDEARMPSEIISAELRDYREKARTQHKDYEPPLERLQVYKRRQLNFSVDREPKAQIHVKPTFPHSAIQGQRQSTEEPGEEPLEEDDLSLDSKEQRPPGVVIMQPKLKVFLNDEVDLYKRNLNKSFEIRNTYQIYQPGPSVVELSLQNRWAQQRQEEVKAKKEDEEMVRAQQQWAKNKSRIDKEIERRIDSRANGSKFTQIDFRKKESLQEPTGMQLQPLPTIINKKKIHQNDFYGYEQRISNARVSHTRNNYQNLLNLSTDNKEMDPDDPQSLSIYGTNKGRSQSFHNKFSTMLQSYSPERFREIQLNEIVEIKNRMAKHKIPMPMNVLKNAMLVPVTEESNLIPNIGQCIMADPFEKVANKKKKKKK